MNPLALSAFYGLAKGLATEGPPGPPRLSLGAHVVAPVVEEVAFRAAPAFAGVAAPVAAVAFAVDHLRVERHTPARAVLRFGDAVLGSFLYQQAFKAYGLPGAIAAHMLHNVAVTLGRAARPARRLQLAGRRRR